MGKIVEVTQREATTVSAVCAVLVPQQARCRFASTSPRAGFPSTPFVSNEDPFDPIDSNAYMMFRVAMGRNQQIVSDDLLMKLNQIGTATVGSSVASTSHLVDRGPVGWGVRCGGEAGKLPGGKMNVGVLISGESGAGKTVSTEFGPLYVIQVW